MLEEHVGNGLDLAKISTKSKEYVFNFFDVEMEKSYFKKPSGIFRTTKGFSMGDLAVTRGSEIILRGAETKILRN